MGTTWSVRLNAARHVDVHALHAGIQARLDRVVAQMSTWEPGSDISAFNRAAAGTWLRIPEEFFAVLSCALRIAEASDGAFDPTIGSLVGLWGFGAEAAIGEVPSMPERDAARDAVGWRRIELRGDGEVLQPGGLRLDLSAIAKGFGADLVVTGLRDAGIAGALVEVGGELHGYGRKPDGTPWRVLVEAGPEEDDDSLEPRVLELDGIAVATSGDRWHHYTRRDEQGEQRRYTHTLDPRSGAPVEHAAVAVTVVARDAMHADAWATALTVLGEAAGFALAEREGLAVRYLSRDANGALHERMTDAFRKHLAP
ncbi:FAD:protein FMN transferase [Thermomonas carbonis]|uniref:FAD:protein FMN transferase n=1 Tax=Thermomonas carbonis TaxID=1463158 RepID=A0A7G9SUF0_9GAMM|nr:FAD:protein FMN transferase [Thermomonas carbonis]QNN71475.1 FAD:protein FMN transferase [Thermomonas carbonis]